MNIILVGERNKLNNTILDILSSQPHFRVDSCLPTILTKDKLNGELKGVDILIVDLTAFSSKPVKSIENLKKLNLDCAVLAVHVYTSTHFIEPILKAGADGYLSSTTTEKEMLIAIRQLANGKRYPQV